MGLLKSKYEKEIDAILANVEMNCSNNYKDAAQNDYRSFEEKYREYVQSGKIKPKEQVKYEKRMAIYQEKLNGFTHKDQKPYWT